MMPHAGELAAEADRNRGLQAQLPVLEFAARHHTERRGALLREVAVILVDELVAQPEPAIAANRINTRQQEVAGGNQFKFTSLDLPLFAADFHPSGQRFTMNATPIEC